ncbi:MAG: Mlc titration factor MtfA (ptsG expression regulator) [Halieaceae bacterium]|jgi:Mlc titration factor MtfA (ptsG expression regulator)
MIAALPILLALIAFGLYFYISRWRKRVLRDKPFPAAWLNVLTSGLPIYESLPQEEQARLQYLMKVFIDQKKFYGCAGLTITEEMKVMIAAEACLLLINKGGAVYPKLTAILVYPSAFRVERDEHQADGTVTSSEHSVLGESWGNGRVILSWDDVEKGVADFTDGHNVVLHEFAHQLDAESGSTNGAPLLRRNSYKSWAAVFSKHFEDLTRRSIEGHTPVMDEYGTTNPAEFFAVATETFFEKPEPLYKNQPELYEELKTYYQVDPRSWHK